MCNRLILSACSLTLKNGVNMFTFYSVPKDLDFGYQVFDSKSFATKILSCFFLSPSMKIRSIFLHKNTNRYQKYGLPVDFAFF